MTTNEKINLKIWDWDVTGIFDRIDCEENFAEVTLYLDNDETYVGKICACRNGCSNTLPINRIQWGVTTLGELLAMMN